MTDKKEMGHLAGGRKVQGLTTVKDYVALYDICAKSFPCEAREPTVPYIAKKKKVRKPK